MAGRRCRGRGRGRRRRHATVIDVDIEEASKEAPILHVEIVSHRSLFDDKMVDVGNLASGSCHHVDDSNLEDGVTYDIKVSLALRGLDLQRIPEHEDLKSALVFAFRRHYERLLNKKD